jgi:hypothetical protein
MSTCWWATSLHGVGWGRSIHNDGDATSKPDSRGLKGDFRAFFNGSGEAEGRFFLFFAAGLKREIRPKTRGPTSGATVSRPEGPSRILGRANGNFSQGF